MLVLGSGCHKSHFGMKLSKACHTYLKGASLRHSHLDIIGLHSLLLISLYIIFRICVSTVHIIHI